MKTVVIFGAQRDVMLPAFHSVSGMWQCEAILVRKPEELTEKLLMDRRPDWVFLPDWSWKIPDNMLNLTQFVGFHAANLPDYRGGSPLQHQILDGLTDTKLSCFRMTADMDGGDILSQMDLSLKGTIGEIWQRIAELIPYLVARLLSGSFTETPQPLGGFSRKRRTPRESRVEFDTTLPFLYDMMRALDHPYPNAYTLIGNKRLLFSKPAFADGKISAQVEITEDPT